MGTLAALAAGVRAASTLRTLGHPLEAAENLWPILQRLESAYVDNRSDVDLVLTTLEARVANCRVIGDLSTDASKRNGLVWANRAVDIARIFRGSTVETQALIQLGNQLRISGEYQAAIDVLNEVRRRSTSAKEHANASAWAARAAAEADLGRDFDEYIADAKDALDLASDDALVNRVSLSEVEARGRLDLGVRNLGNFLDSPQSEGEVAPQWNIIARITLAEAFYRSGDSGLASETLLAAAIEARKVWLPRQIERAIAIAEVEGGIGGKELAAHMRRNLLIPRQSAGVV